MITARFVLKNERPIGFWVSGHAGYAEYGKDIVCAAVTSAITLTLNTITEFFEQDANVRIEDNLVALKLITQDEASYRLLESLSKYLMEIEHHYGGIRVLFTDAQDWKG
jgi:uncharacterized protein YsxB (DUF464 family)